VRSLAFTDCGRFRINPCADLIEEMLAAANLIDYEARWLGTATEIKVPWRV
jgi:hypothetical protein